jgi:uncharacterized cupredoxin-like copper-binding protein
VIREPEKETTVTLRPKRIPSRRGLWSLGAVFLIAAAASLGLAACGGDDNGDETTTTPGGKAEEATTGGGGGGQTVKIGETEYKLDPADPSVKAGTVTFDVSNDGKIDHNLEVEGPTEEQELPQDLAPGDSGKLTVDLSKPGKYEMYCPIDDHKGLGMEGEITVE